MNKIIIIGLDGADWSIINYLLKKDRLPTFKKLKKDGAYGTLKSVLPISSAPAWTSFLTGKNPGKHGIFDFLKFNRQTNRIEVVSSNDRKSSCVWNFLKNKKSIIINVPLTFPPDKINGIMISGLPNPENTFGYCYPKEIYSELMREFNGDIKIQPQIFYHKNAKKDFLKDQYMCWRNNEKIFWYLKNKKEWDLLICVFHVIDEFSHELWKYIDKNHPGFEKNKIGENIFRIYEKADRFLLRLLGDLDENTTLFVVSDHGFGPVYKTFYLNNWFMDKGWLKLKNTLSTKIRKSLHNSGFNAYNMLNLFRKIGLNPLSRAYKETFTQDKSLLVFFSQKLFLSADDIDWKSSKAYSMGEFGQIYIKKENVKDYRKFLLNLKRELKKLKDDETGKKIFDYVFTKYEIYKGDFLEEAPDVIFYDKNMYYSPVKMFEFGSNKLITPQAVGRSGGHKLNGIFLAYGKNINSVSNLNLEIVDVTPTILYLLGEKIPESMDGKVIEEIISKNILGKRKIRYFEEKEEIKNDKGITKSDEKIIVERLKKLGYM